MSASPIRAVIDIGSNSIKILVAEYEGKRWVRTLFQETDDTRIGGYLGQGQSGMTEESLRLGVMSVEKLMKLAEPFAPNIKAIVATSAVRDADNGDAFCRLIRGVTGVTVRVLSGDEEALAIADGIRCDPDLAGQKNFRMLDQGGGSLEWVQVTGEDVHAVSYPLGAVRLFKEFQKGDLGPLTEKARRGIRERVGDLCGELSSTENRGGKTCVGTGGALSLTRALLAAREGVKLQDRSPLLGRQEIEDFFEEIAGMDMEGRMVRAKVPATRADILPCGLCALLAVMECAGVESIHHSWFNLRFGVAAQLVS